MQHSGTSEGERLVIGTSGSAHMARLETYVLHALTWNILAEATEKLWWLACLGIICDASICIHIGV